MTTINGVRHYPRTPIATTAIKVNDATSVEGLQSPIVKFLTAAGGAEGAERADATQSHGLKNKRATDRVVIVLIYTAAVMAGRPRGEIVLRVVCAP